jgi:hypothetical protein
MLEPRLATDDPREVIGVSDPLSAISGQQPAQPGRSLTAENSSS